MEPPAVPEVGGVRANDDDAANGVESRRRSSQASSDSQTASEFINSQLQLEADAREILPYAFDSCTNSLGPLRQSLFSCLTCNPPPELPSDPYTPAGVCYSCSIACHGEHTLVELFNKRHFVCDCGTTRFPSTSPCTLRADHDTGIRGVHSESAASGNRYNQNFRNRFCGCGEVYDAHSEKGTMFQCVGLGSVEDGGCGEDWWHPECIAGLGRDWHKKEDKTDGPIKPESQHQPDQEVEPKPGDGPDQMVDPENEDGQDQEVQAEKEVEQGPEDPPVPPGFPDEEDFEAFICYKCVHSNPWIKRYAGTSGFLNPFLKQEPAKSIQPPANNTDVKPEGPREQTPIASQDLLVTFENTNKRKLDDDVDYDSESTTSKRFKNGADESSNSNLPAPPTCRYESLPQPTAGNLSLFCKEDFRERFCHCPIHFPLLRPFPQLLEEEETYEPPLSRSGDDDAGSGARSHGTGSLLDRGEAALSNVDRVRAIEGVMVYNHLRDKVKAFLQPFAESGQAVGAEDIKKYFEKLRGDEAGIRAAAAEGGTGSEDNRREQSGY